MGFRRSPDPIAAGRAWRRFVERNAHVITRTGLPPIATASITNWDDFLMHGYLAGDPGGFDVGRLAPTEYSAVVELTTNYFTAGYGFFTPMALHVEDQAALRARFGAGD